MTSESLYRPVSQSPSPTDNHHSSSESGKNGKDGPKTTVATRGSGKCYKVRHFKKILVRLMSRLVVDIVLWASFILAVLYTERVGALNRDEKHLFNAVGVGLPLMLGLNYNSSFQAMAGIMRWKVLESSTFTFKETDLILSLDSFLTVTKLGVHWFKQIVKGERKKRWMYFGRALACLGWVILTLGSQVGVGLLGLTFDFNSQDALIPENGKVWVTNLTTYSRSAPPSIPVAVGNPTLNEEQYRAHQYGDLWDQFVKGPSTYETANPNYGSNISIVWLDKGEWEYRFQDWTGTKLDPRQQSIVSNRNITIKTNCTIFPYLEMFTRPHHLNWTLLKLDDMAPDSVTFLNFDADGQKGEYSCGPRCASIGGIATNWYEGTPTNSTESQWNVTECDVKISNVQGAHEEYYQLSNAVAQLAAGAIAMDGIAQTQGTYQLYRYNNRTAWGGNFVDKNEVARRVGRFAAGSIALLDFYGDTVDQKVDGRKALIGVKLTAKRPQLWIVMGLLVGVHMTLIPIVLCLGSTAPYADGSHLSTAILFQNVLTEVQDKQIGEKFVRSKEYHKEKKYRTEYKNSKDGFVLEAVRG